MKFSKLPSVADGSFVPAAFYVEPPQNASPEDWKAWLKADEAKARAAKAAHTRATKHSPIPDNLAEKVMVKVHGKWTQGLNIAIAGEEGNTHGEVAVPSTQEQSVVAKDLEARRHKRGGSKAGRSKRRRANKKARGIK